MIYSGFFCQVNFPVVSGGLALLAGTGAIATAGLSGGVVTGLMAVGTLGLFGELE